jgi:NDP-sugar pyrophosphorylase family protein
MYTVRLYDGFDNEWMDIETFDNYDEAKKLWNDRTKNGTENTSYNDIDYYIIKES